MAGHMVTHTGSALCRARHRLGDGDGADEDIPVALSPQQLLRSASLDAPATRF